jgi:hypothetical protein
VAIYDGSTLLGNATANGNGTWSYTASNLADGNHAFHAVVTDTAGNSTTTAALPSLTIDTTPPSNPTVTDSAVQNGYVNAANDTASQTLSGTALANSTVAIYLNGGTAPVYTVQANASGAWSQVIGALANGTYSYTATVTDAAGNTSAPSSALSFTVDTLTPTVASVASSQGTFQAGSMVTITLATSEAVTVSGGTPTLTLNDGETAAFNAAQSTSTALAFDYTVGANDKNSPALAINAINLNGSIIQDAAGNAANLSAAETTLSGTYINTPVSGNETLTVGANSTITLGNGNDNETAGANSTITLGNGVDQVTAGANSTITLGNGNDTVLGSATNITAGNGSDTITSGANATIVVGNGTDTITAGPSSSITIGSGADTIYAGASDTINLGRGSDLIAFGVNPSALTIGNEVVNNFVPKQDVIEFNQALFANYAAVIGAATQSGPDTIITLPSNEGTVTLNNIAPSSLTAQNFKFV